ncbi:XRE family transcriptional regulator [Chroococcidiopsis sp. CCMEE 29]|uniref:XRE family transcriptional regulator n=1 Tax=Chroococcidiopsis sp. CCMEE 29 TaxID=155894 RepID=UPI0020201149|nr:XRE family transcriptional regulator [Chroococcidiopsis sp. CCMEE 29]
MKEIIAGNLTRYRKGLRLSQEELAEQAGVTRQSINNYENAKTLPDSKTLSALARALKVTLDDLLRLSGSTVLPAFRFRAHTSDKNPQFAATVLRLLEDYTALEQAVGMPPYAPESTPCHQVEGNEKRIAEIANQFRHRLGLGDGPIHNLFEAVEEIGLKVLRYSIPIPGFFGLSACSADQGAFVLVNTHNVSIERQLFTLAHEIGHLIFHRSEYQDSLMEEGTKEEEKAREAVANHFASHLLVSQKALDRALDIFNDLIQLKAHFRVSYTMMLMRLEQMGKLKYGDAIQKIRGEYKRRTGESLPKQMELEPVLPAAEFLENQRFTKLVWQALWAGHVSELKAAELLNLTVEDLRLARREAKAYAIDAIF